MRRHILDGLIIAAALGVGATDLYAQGAARKVIQPNQVASVGHGVVQPRGGAVIDGPVVATDGQRNAVGAGPQRAAAVNAAHGTMAAAGPLTRGTVGPASAMRKTTAAASAGATHSTLCVNAAGSVASCPK